MYPILIKLLSDNESLFEYERNLHNKEYVISFEHIKRRLIALERMSNIIMNDNYYEDLGKISFKKYANLAQFLSRFPQDMSNDLLCNVGGIVYVRKEKLNDWMDLLVQIPPALFIAGYVYSRLMTALPKTLKEIEDFVEKYLVQFRFTALPIAYLPELNFLIKDCGLHDLHIHLNGSTESDIIWGYMLKHPYETVRNYTQGFKMNLSIRKLTEQTCADFTPDKFGERLFEARSIRSYLCRIISHDIFDDKICMNKDDDYSIQDLWRVKGKAYSFFTPIIEEVIFYLYIFDHLGRTENDYIACKFHHYLLIKGIIHRTSVMQNSQYGFSQFQYITDFPSRFGVEYSYKNRFLQLAGASPQKYLAFIEGRFSPGNNRFQINELVRRIYKGFDDAKKESDYHLLDNVELYLVAHFIKKKEKSIFKAMPIRHRELRHELLKRALALIQFINTNEEYGSKIKGIDAAASEFDAGPEVFAPIFRLLRKHDIARCTFHAGEDFKHIISGIRNIYEAAYFLDMQHGDRLGHCTAIGIDPVLWFERIERRIVISQGEWLDDLVFLWYIINDSGNEILRKHIPLIEGQIAEFTYKVYGRSFPPYILSEAWKLRKYCPILYLEKSKTSFYDFDIVDSYENDKAIRDKIDEDIGYIMRRYHRISGDFDGRCYDELIEIEGEKILSSSDIRILQGVIIEYLNKNGIIIESLPTSNIRISYYRNAKEYHLKNWMKNSISPYTPPIVLGTDDPGIFSTNIFNEYARAYLHFEENELSSLDIYNQLSFIHRNSIIYKFCDHE